MSQFHTAGTLYVADVIPVNIIMAKTECLQKKKLTIGLSEAAKSGVVAAARNESGYPENERRD